MSTRHIKKLLSSKEDESTSTPPKKDSDDNSSDDGHPKGNRFAALISSSEEGPDEPAEELNKPGPSSGGKRRAKKKRAKARKNKVRSQKVKDASSQAKESDSKAQKDEVPSKTQIPDWDDDEEIIHISSEEYSCDDSDSQSDLDENLDEAGPSTGIKKRKMKKRPGFDVRVCTHGRFVIDEDEIDIAMREIGRMNLDEPPAEVPVPEPGTDPIDVMFSCNRAFFDVYKELYSLYGKKAMDEETSDRYNLPVVQKHKFIRPKKDLPPHRHYTAGNKMRLLYEIENKKYFIMDQSVLFQAASNVLRGRYTQDQLTDIVMRCTGHTEALVAWAEIYLASNEMQMYRETIEEALYFLECSSCLDFKPETGLCRMEYKHPENRGMHIVLFRYMENAANRLAVKTAFEVAKALISLDHSDPLAVILIIDYYTIRGEQFNWLVNMYETLEASKNLSLLPNMAFSVALAYRRLGQKGDESAKEKADRYLKQAIIKFPTLLTALFKKKSYTPANILRDRPDYEEIFINVYSEALETLVTLYFSRAFILWVRNLDQRWLLETALEVLDDKDSRSQIKTFQARSNLLYQGLPLPIKRHIFHSNIDEVELFRFDERWKAVEVYPPKSDLEVPPATRQLPPTNDNVTLGDRVQAIFQSLWHSLFPNTD